jgi:hypothetical protein
MYNPVFNNLKEINPLRDKLVLNLLCRISKQLALFGEDKNV